MRFTYEQWMEVTKAVNKVRDTFDYYVEIEPKRNGILVFHIDTKLTKEQNHKGGLENNG